MRIAHIIESTSGGSVRAAMALVREMSAQGHDVTFIYSPTRADTVFKADLADLKVTKKLALPMERKVGPHDLRSAIQLYRLIKKTGPYDVLHAHSSKAGALARITGVFFSNMKVFYSPHAFVSMSPESNSFYAKIEKLLAPLATKIIAVSQAEKIHAVDTLKIDADKVTIIPNGITFPQTTTRGEARSYMGYSEKNKVIGFVGRLSEQKNPLRLIKAIAPIVKEYPQLQLAIIGNGELLEIVKKEIEFHNIGSQIRMWHDQDARTLMSGLDALICSSDYEGLPLVFLEALQASAPIISTPVGGAKECIIHNKTGYIADDFSSESLSKALRSYLVLEPHQRKEMEAAAKKHGDSFTAQIMAEKTLELYNP